MKTSFSASHFPIVMAVDGERVEVKGIYSIYTLMTSAEKSSLLIVVTVFRRCVSHLSSAFKLDSNKIKALAEFFR